MRKSILFLSLSFIAFSTQAQIQITSAAMPAAGDTVRFSSASPIGLNLNLAKKGASQSWDYSNLVSTGQDISQYVSANKTPYLFYFFNQIGQKTADSFGVGQFSFRNIYSFYSKSSTVFKAEGLGYEFSSIPLASNYTDEDEIYQFPLAYGDSDVTTFRFKFSIPGQNFFSVVQKGKRTNIVDGWGSIKTPYKTYTDVLRVKTIVDEIDSIVSTFGGTAFPRKQVVYKWLSADEKIPVLEITGTEALGVFTAQQIRFRDAYNGKGNPLGPRASYSVNKKSGFAEVDTFTFTDRTTPFATGTTWSITPSTAVVYVKGTSATSRNPSVVFKDKGSYSVKLTASNIGGSDDTVSNNLISISFGANTQGQISPALMVYPNPASSYVVLPANCLNKRYIISDAFGRNIQEDMSTEGRINISGLAEGVFNITVDGNTVKLCVVKE
jgi:PKD repeat protein